MAKTNHILATLAATRAAFDLDPADTAQHDSAQDDATAQNAGGLAGFRLNTADRAGRKPAKTSGASAAAIRRLADGDW